MDDKDQWLLDRREQWDRTEPKDILDALERVYRSGQKDILMSALLICAIHKLEIPTWVRDSLISAYRTRPKSWDDVFGPPVPKGKSVTAFNRRVERLIYVIWRVKQLNERGMPIEEAFQKVGKEIGMSAGSARQAYYDEIANRQFEAVAEGLSLLLAHEVGEAASDDDKAAWIRNNLPSKLASKKLS